MSREQQQLPDNDTTYAVTDKGEVLLPVPNPTTQELAELPQPSKAWGITRNIARGAGALFYAAVNTAFQFIRPKNSAPIATGGAIITAATMLAAAPVVAAAAPYAIGVGAVAVAYGSIRAAYNSKDGILYAARTIKDSAHNISHILQSGKPQSQVQALEYRKNEAIEMVRLN